MLPVDGDGVKFFNFDDDTCGFRGSRRYLNLKVTVPKKFKLYASHSIWHRLDTRINWLSNVALRGVKAVSALSRA
jgi:hypothetical protein